MQFAGDAPGTDLVDVTRIDEGAFVNLCLVPYFRNIVVFDVERGLVAFGPCS